MSRIMGNITAGSEKEFWGVGLICAHEIKDHTILFETENTAFQWEEKKHGQADKIGRYHGKLEAVTKRKATASESALKESANEMAALFMILKSIDIDNDDSLSGVVTLLGQENVEIKSTQHVNGITLELVGKKPVRAKPQLTVTVELRHVFQFFKKCSEGPFLNERNKENWIKRRAVMADAIWIASQVLDQYPPKKEGGGLRNADKIRGYLTLVAQVVLVSRRARNRRYLSLKGESLKSDHKLTKDAYGLLHKTPLAELWRSGLSLNDRIYLINHTTELGAMIIDLAWGTLPRDSKCAPDTMKISGDDDDIKDDDVVSVQKYVLDVLGGIRKGGGGGRRDLASKKTRVRLANSHYDDAVDADARRIYQRDKPVKDETDGRMRVALELRDLGTSSTPTLDATMLMDDYRKVVTTIGGIQENYLKKHNH